MTIKTKRTKTKIHEARYVVASELPSALRDAAFEVVDTCAGEGRTDADVFISSNDIGFLFLDECGDGPIPGIKQLSKYLEKHDCSLYVG